MGINTVEELRILYGWPRGRAKEKVLSGLEKHSKYFIECSPFLVLSTYDKEGRSDCSPRGGKPGFVRIINNESILIPDAKGNNRVDSLINIVESGNIACLFLIPGINETLRLNGKATITIDPEYLKLFSEEQIPPKTCIKVMIEEVFLHCAKAFMRSKLWEETYRKSRPGFPTINEMLNDQLLDDGHIETQEEMIERYTKDL